MKNYKKMYEQVDNFNRRNYQKFKLLEQWLRLSHAGVRFGEFFEDYHINSLAIYGIGELGRLFYDELLSQGKESLVKYIIDKNKNIDYKNVQVFTLDEKLEKVDAIIISPVLITDEIEDDIYIHLGEQKTFTIEEILYELSRKHQVTSELWEI